MTLKPRFVVLGQPTSANNWLIQARNAGLRGPAVENTFCVEGGLTHVRPRADFDIVAGASAALDSLFDVYVAVVHRQHRGHVLAPWFRAALRTQSAQKSDKVGTRADDEVLATNSLLL